MHARDRSVANVVLVVATCWKRQRGGGRGEQQSNNLSFAWSLVTYSCLSRLSRLLGFGGLQKIWLWVIATLIGLDAYNSQQLNICLRSLFLEINYVLELLNTLLLRHRGVFFPPKKKRGCILCLNLIILNSYASSSAGVTLDAWLTCYCSGALSGRDTKEKKTWWAHFLSDCRPETQVPSFGVKSTKKR